MKCLSCTNVSKTSDEATKRHCIPIEYKNSTNPGVQGHNTGPRFQTLIEVMRCELGRPGRATNTDDGSGPRKHWTPLYYAVYHNREAALLHFLRAGQSPDSVAELGQPPLYIAATAGHDQIVKILCEAGADVNAPTRHNGETSLHIAIKNGRSDIMDILIPYGPDLNTRTMYTGETPLHYAAARAGSLAVVVSLLKHGADYEALNVKGWSPAEVALQSQNLHAAVAMISAARGERRKLIKEKEMLLKHVEKAQNRFSMNNELIADVFEASCPPDSTVLIEAIKRDDAGLVEMFLEKDADPNRANASGLCPIFVALRSSSAKVVHALVKHGADVTAQDPQGLTVLQAALESSCAQDKEAISALFESLLSRNADPHVKYPDGATLLHRAIGPSLGLVKVAQQLLHRDVNVNVNEQEKSGNSALHVATHSKTCMALLLKHGANAKMVNRVGLTPLLLATTNATTEQEPDLELLIKSSNIRKLDQSGSTALHIAAQNGLEKTVRLLLQARADTTSVDSQNRTPLLLAVLNQRWSIVPLLATQPGINSWDGEGRTALHHIAMSIPKLPATWKDVATAVAPFCEKGVSRSMRDRSGATPLIQAVKSLPEDGLPVIEALLSQRASERINCIGHEDHQSRDALYYAATIGKPSFVTILLQRGAPFQLEQWRPSKGPVQPNSDVNKRILKSMADQEWLRRASALQRRPETQPAIGLDEHFLPKILPIRDLNQLLIMGLDPNAPAKSRFACPLWSILNQTLQPPDLPPQYLHDILNLLFSFKADANAVTTRSLKPVPNAKSSQRIALTLHTLSFLLEQHPSVDIGLVKLFLDNSAKLSDSSSFYDGRYPLHSAINANRMDIIESFLGRGADVNSKDKQHRTVLFVAAEKGTEEIVDRLLRSRAKLDTKDMKGNTLLHAAVVGGSSKIVSRLLRAGTRASEANQENMLPSACVPSEVGEKESEKILGLLKYAEEQERREDARKDKASEKRAAEKTSGAISNASEQKLASKTSPPSTISLGPPKPAVSYPSPPPQRASVATNPTSTQDFKPTASLESNANTDVHVSKQIVSIRYTPPSPKRQHPTAAPKLSPESPTKKGTSPTQTRVDSGLDLQPIVGEEKSVPALSRSKTTFDQTPDDSDQGEELASWLTMSKMMERL